MLRGLSLWFWGRRWRWLGFLPRWRRSGFVLRRRLLRMCLWLNLLLTLRRRSLLLLPRWRCLLRMRLRLNLLLALRRRCLLLLPRWRCLLRMRLRLNLLLALRRRSWSRLILRRRCLLRMRLWLDLLSTLGRSQSGLVLSWWRRYRSSSRLIGGRLIAIRLNILLCCVGLTSAVGLLLLRGVGRCGRWRGARSRSGARWNYRGDGFALRDRLGHCNDGGLAVIDGGELLAILGGLFAVLNLGGHRGNALLASGG